MQPTTNTDDTIMCPYCGYDGVYPPDVLGDKDDGDRVVITCENCETDYYAWYETRTTYHAESKCQKDKS